MIPAIGLSLTALALTFGPLLPLNAQEFETKGEVVEALAEPVRAPQFQGTMVAGEAVAGPLLGVLSQSDLGIDPELDVSLVDSDQLFVNGFE